MMIRPPMRRMKSLRPERAWSVKKTIRNVKMSEPMSEPEENAPEKEPGLARAEVVVGPSAASAERRVSLFGQVLRCPVKGPLVQRLEECPGEFLAVAACGTDQISENHGFEFGSKFGGGWHFR